MRSFEATALALLLAACAKNGVAGPEDLVGARAPIDRVDVPGLARDETRERPVLVAFWASWNEASIAMLEKLTRALADRKDVALVAIAEDESHAASGEAAQLHDFDFPLHLDRHREAARAWHVRRVPTVFLVDSSGRVRSAWQGDRALDASAIARAARDLGYHPSHPLR